MTKHQHAALTGFTAAGAVVVAVLAGVCKWADVPLCGWIAFMLAEAVL